jgi:hypothetical protein
MNATPPETNSEYSRGSRRSGRLLVTPSGAARVPAAEGSEAGSEAAPGPAGAVPEATGGPSGALGAALLAGGLLGVLLLLVAEFTTLFQVHVAASGTRVRSVSTGSHHSYALALIAVVAAVQAVAAWRAASRPALLALGVLGVVALLIALVGDLPDASATGLVLHSGHYVIARSTPSAGFYFETLGAVVLLLTTVSGFLLIGPPVTPRSRAD